MGVLSAAWNVFKDQANDYGQRSSADSFGPAPSGYGSMYDQLFASNPYRNQSYTKTPMQALASALGFRTAYDDWFDQTSTQIAEYDASVMSQIQQNQFNSPAAMAQRERQAGINPDLAGIGDVASAAVPVEDPNGMTPQDSSHNFQDALQTGIDVSRSVLSLIPGVLSFGTQLTQLRGVRLENSAKELAFGSGVFDMAKSYFDTEITPSEYQAAFDSGDFSNLLDKATAKAKTLSETFFSDKESRKKFTQAYGRYANSLAAEMRKYQSYDEYEKARGSLLSQRSKPWFSDDDDTMQNLLGAFLNPSIEYNKKMSEIANKYAEQEGVIRGAELNLQAEQIENQTQFEQNLDPSAQAGAENATNRLTAQQNEIMQATNELFSSIMTNLQQSDSWWSKIAMALVGIARAQLLSGIHGSFQRNNSYKSIGPTPDGGVSSTSGNSSFNFGF